MYDNSPWALRAKAFDRYQNAHSDLLFAQAYAPEDQPRARHAFDRACSAYRQATRLCEASQRRSRPLAAAA